MIRVSVSNAYDAPKMIPSPLYQRLESCVAEQANRLHDNVARAARPASGDTPPWVPAVAWMAYGPDEGDACVQIAADLGSPAAEYAVIRRGVGVMDGCHRGTLRVRGTDRLSFFQRMVTQHVQDMKPGSVRESFWLNRKGRVQADLLLAEFSDVMLIDVDRFAAAVTAAELKEFVFGEDMHIEDAGQSIGRLSLHGSAVLSILMTLGLEQGALAENLSCAAMQLGAHAIFLARRDQAGILGVELFVPAGSEPEVFDAVLAARGEGSSPIRPIGWHAFNVARIEGGTPLFRVDFGQSALPHETGLLSKRVSFKKGCYLGQEVVARMESLGKPKQKLVALRMEQDVLPVCGAVVHVEAADGEPIGTITSSAPSPMLSNACVAFASIKNAWCEPGHRVRVAAEGAWASAVVQPTLRFLPGGTP